MLQTLLGNWNKKLVAVYGVPSSGKTSLCLEAASYHLNHGKKVIFVDTEKGFSIERFKQLAGKEYAKYLERILLFTPNSFKDQHLKILQLQTLVRQGGVGLVVVDTIGYYYRRFMKNRPSLGNAMLIKQIHALQEIAKTVPVIVSNQVYTSVDENKIKMVGGEILARRSEMLIELEKEPERKFIVRKPRKEESLFTITDKGFSF